MGPKKFRKKAVVIEAMQFNGTNYDAVVDWVRAGGVEIKLAGTRIDPETLGLVVSNETGDGRVSANDWVIKGVKGEFYPCKPDIFAETYEEV